MKTAFVIALLSAVSVTSCTIGAGDSLGQLTTSDPFFVAAGINRTTYVSDDGKTWVETANLGSGQYLSSAYGNGGFSVAGNNAAGDGIVIQSADGGSWQNVLSLSTNEQVRAVSYFKGVYFLTSFNGGLSERNIYASNEGDKWINVYTGASPNYLLSFAYGDDTFLAAGSNVILRSENGNNWAVLSDSTGKTVNDMVYAQGMFVLAGNDTLTMICVSTDGYTFSPNLLNTTSADSLRGITYGNGRFVAVGTVGQVWYSDDGLDWHYVSVPSMTNIFDVTYGNGMFVAVGSGGAGGRIIYSEDGIAWNAAYETANGIFTVTRRP